MIVNNANLAVLLSGFKASFNKGFEGATSQYRNFTMLAPSSTRDQTYAWLGQIPRMREWLGEKRIKSLEVHGYTITNREFELTIEVPKTDIEDDQYGVYGPMFEEMGRSANEFPDELVFSLLKEGFSKPCFDGQNFFDTEHPVSNENGAEGLVSNMQDGSGPAWFLMDTSRAIKPLIYQERKAPRFAGVDNDSDDYVFRTGKFLYGMETRGNVGFGLWQLAFASKAELTPENYAAARLAMQTMKGDEGRLLGIQPTTLLVPPMLESAARKIVSNSLNADGGTNEWAGTATPIITPWLA